MIRKIVSFIAALTLSATAFAGRQVIVTTTPGATDAPHAAAMINAMTQELYSKSIVPPPALAVGYTNRTFGPDITIGSNWFLCNLLGKTPVPGQATQNSDGSVSLGAVADGSGFGAALCSAQKILSGTSWSGFAVGGGEYIEYELSFTPTLNLPGGILPFPAAWAEEIDYLAQIGGAVQWVGQASGYQHRIELDVMQWPHNSLQFYATSGMIDWSGLPASITPLVLPSNSETHINVPMGQRNKYATLIVPATATTQGYMQNFLNGVLVSYAAGASPVVWNRYNPAAAPPLVAGTSAGSLIDVSHLALILGTDVTSPMTVYSVSVWQGPGAGNTTGPIPTTTSVVPNIVTHGTAAFTVAVNGTNFTRLATVFWNGVALATTYGSANQVFAVVPAADIASVNTATVTVANGPFQISNGTPLSTTSTWTPFAPASNDDQYDLIRAA